MVRILAVATVCAWALACSPASASTVRSAVHPFTDLHGQADREHTVTVAATPGEANRLELTLDPGGVARLRDPAGLTPVAPCVAEDRETVTCPYLGQLRVDVDLGDGDDTFSGSAGYTTVDGGAGDDVLQGAASLRGGPGDDRLTGGSVQGGPGADVLAGSTLDYTDHTTGVTIDLAGGPAGSPGEGDQVAPGATSVEGTPAADVIRAAEQGISVVSYGGDDVIDGSPRYDRIEPGAGNDVVLAHAGDDEVIDEVLGDPEGPRSGDDRFDGGPGNDHLNAGPGDDVLIGGEGHDTLLGESGTDRMRADDGERDNVVCTETRLEGDRADVDSHDNVAAACEHITRSGTPRLEVHALLRAGGPHPRLLLSCPRGATRRACAGTVGLQSGGLRATVRVQLSPGRRARLRVDRLPARGTYRVKVALRTGREWRDWLSVVRP